jgi:flagellar capping protein FliD
MEERLSQVDEKLDKLEARVDEKLDKLETLLTQLLAARS